MRLQNVEAEQALVGAILINNEVLDRVAGIVTPEDFYEALHGRIFEVCRDRINAGDTVTATTIKAHFEDDPAIEALGGVSYLARLAGAAISLFAARDYAKTIAQLAKRREVRDILTVANTAIEDPDKDLAAVMGGVESEILAMESRRGGDSNVVTFQRAVVGAARLANEAFGSKALLGITTGLPTLDGMLGGLRRKQLVILAGRPSMGKSMVALSMGLSAARAGHNVGFVTLEMSTDEIGLRAISEQTAHEGRGVAYQAAAAGNVSDGDMEGFLGAAKSIQNLPVSFFEKCSTLGEIFSEMRKLKRRLVAEGKNLDLVVVDYLQIIRPHSRRGNRNEEITDISGGLKQMARELDVPVLALAQLSRQVESREDKRPQLADLRDSGAIEQDADVVIFCYREEYYLSRSKPDAARDYDAYTAWQGAMDACAGKMDLIVAKQRMGPTGGVIVACDAPVNRIRDLGA